jgi:hypothetical protein
MKTQPNTMKDGKGPSRTGETAEDREVIALVRFCQLNGGTCFARWPQVTLRCYARFHLRQGTAFMVTNGDAVRAVAFAWGSTAQKINTRHKLDWPCFDWTVSQDHGDAVMLAEIVGERVCLPDMFEQMQERWPDLLTHKKVFSYRRGKLRVLPPTLLHREVYGQ